MSRRFLRSRTFPWARDGTRAMARRSSQFAPFTGSFTHFAHSLVGQLKILNVFTLLSRFTGTNAFFVSTRNTPWKEERKWVVNIILQSKFLNVAPPNNGYASSLCFSHLRRVFFPVLTHKLHQMKNEWGGPRLYLSVGQVIFHHFIILVWFMAPSSFSSAAFTNSPYL